MKRDETSDEPPDDAASVDPTGGPTEGATRVDVSKLDALLGLVGELGAVEQALDRLSEGLRVRGGDDELAREARHVRRRLRRGLSALREGVLEARVVRLDRLFRAAVEDVEELAAERGKRVRVITRGGDVEIDRALADELDRLLAQLVRNAVVHGIEPAAERLAAGKPESGTLDLSAGASGGSLRLSVADDGRGLAPSDARGPGLDAVRATATRLGGSLVVHGASGTGTRITLDVPLTLLRLHALVFDLRGRPTAVARDAVREVRSRAEEAGATGAVLVELTARPAPLAVERVRGHAQLVVKPFGPSLADVRGFVGAAELDSGELALVLDPAVPWEEASGSATALRRSTQASAERVNATRTPARSFVVELGATRRALDLSKVRGVEPVPALTTVPGAPADVVGVAFVHGALTTVLDGRRLTGGEGAAGPLVLVDVGEEVVALRVDRVVGVTDPSTGADEPPPLLDLALTARPAPSER